MKKLSFILVLLISTSCSYINQSNTQDYSGKYTSMDAASCPIELTITKAGKDHTYSFKLNEIKQEGKLEVIEQNETIYFKLIGLLGADPKVDIEFQLMDEAIVIQNYGNAMNQFTRFSDCDLKYIQLAKSE